MGTFRFDINMNVTLKNYKLLCQAGEWTPKQCREVQSSEGCSTSFSWSGRGLTK